MGCISSLEHETPVANTFYQLAPAKIHACLHFLHSLLDVLVSNHARIHQQLTRNTSLHVLHHCLQSFEDPRASSVCSYLLYDCCVDIHSHPPAKVLLIGAFIRLGKSIHDPELSPDPAKTNTIPDMNSSIQ